MNTSKVPPSEHRSYFPSSEPVILVTGASSGFGMLISITMAKRGYRVIASMRELRNQDQLMEQASAAKVDGVINCVEMDVTDHGTISKVIAEIIERYGRIDVLVNNAGMAIGGFIEEVPILAWQQQMDVNFIGLVTITKAVLPFMRQQRSGTIFNISSVSGRVGFPGYAPYVASKFAVEGFSEALRLEMKPHGVKVVLIEPGAYPTKIWQKGFDSIHATPQSPYQEQLDAVLSYSKSTLHNGADPQEIADAIARISKLRRPKLRYAMGKGVLFLLFIKALLPWNCLEQLMLILLKIRKAPDRSPFDEDTCSKR
ncbi:NADP-dependent 3-hydroxy acid dehydrogenase YdfG [Paenibacillus sp. 1_12]|uniref:SDR family oxidoreductase n=1 Tax=Paenibacillus sp. 1_12 TaxID=1566278 RepID=UPI0008E6147D|nr:SDR family oxidoreductase [Paenibacillus sp. 1_12]SFK90397.1 NADP-dependent 3-hydroxy acid dehydrogenase YdfG [Paenibacillus sp. 1_12]